MRKLKTFLGLPRRDQWIVIQSMLLLPLVTVLLGTIGLARCWALLERLNGGRTDRGAREGPDLRRTVLMVDLAARRLFDRRNDFLRSNF